MYVDADRVGAELVKLVRKKLGYTQARLVAEYGGSQNQIYLYERQKCRVPFYFVHDICEHFKLDYAECYKEARRKVLESKR